MKFLYASGSRPLEGYTIKRGIGRGGFGEVYYATSDAGKEVALKLVRRNLDIEIRGVSQCLNLKHPHLLSLYDIRTDAEDNTWVVMEYVGGQALDEVLARNPDGLPIPEVLAWIHGIGSGVAYLHDRGIVHRDLKPGNVFCDEGLVKLGDYGLTKFISASRRSGQTESVGTVHYMAPEVANGRYGKEIDIYALGVMLYEMLTGRVPFEGESVGEVLMKHLTAQPDLSRVNEPFRTLIARTLEKDPDQRIHSVHEMLAALPQPATPDVRVNPAATKYPQGGHAAGAAHRQAGNGAAGVAGARAAGSGGTAEEDVVIARVAEDASDPVTRALGEMWREIRGGWSQLLDAWDKSEMGALARVAVLILAFLIALHVVPIIATAAVLGGIAYVVYRIAWSIGWSGKKVVTGSKASPPPGPPPSPAAAPTSPPRPQPAVYRPTTRAELAESIAHKPARDKLLELTGSMLLAALVVGLLSVVVFAIFEPSADSGLERARLVWVALVAVVGAWAVMAPAKLWEGTRGDATLRRFTLLVVGLGLGAFAYVLQTAMVGGLPYTSGGFKEYLLFFGLLFPIGRWWDAADPLRKERIHLGRLFGAGLWAWLLQLFIGIPGSPAWHLVAIAVMIACSVQLASPWVGRKPRAMRSAA